MRRRHSRAATPRFSRPPMRQARRCAASTCPSRRPRPAPMPNWPSCCTRPCGNPAHHCMPGRCRAPGRLAAQLLDGVWSGSLARLHREGIALQVLACALQNMRSAACALAAHPSGTGAAWSACASAWMQRRARRCSWTTWRAWPHEPDHAAQGWAPTARPCSAGCASAACSWRASGGAGAGACRAADCVGFQHASNFATAFRQRFGHLQGELRRKP